MLLEKVFQNVWIHKGLLYNKLKISEDILDILGGPCNCKAFGGFAILDVICAIVDGTDLVVRLHRLPPSPISAAWLSRMQLLCLLGTGSRTCERACPAG
jgi:hypothetical protein